MEFIERIAASILFRHLLQEECFGQRFEDLFHRLMTYSDAGYVPVRTAGSSGDLGADGVTVGKKLYACYGPEVYDPARAVRKLDSDLARAVSARPGTFDTFVLVHNGLRGLHPTLSLRMAELGREHPGLKLEVLGPVGLRRMLLALEQQEVEDVLGRQIPVEVARFRVGVEDLTDLLDHLARTRIPATFGTIPVVPTMKMEFNDIEEQTRSELRDAMKYTYLVERYYEERREIPERDAVATGIHEEYVRLRADCSGADEVLWHLEQYILGNASAPFSRRRAAMVVLAHFFESCDIFEEPTPEWLSERSGV